MPLYEYRCPVCQVELELSRPVDQRDDVACPQCGAVLQRRFPPRAYLRVPLRFRQDTEDQAYRCVLGEKGEFRETFEERVKRGELERA